MGLASDLEKASVKAKELFIDAEAQKTIDYITRHAQVASEKGLFSISVKALFVNPYVVAWAKEEGFNCLYDDGSPEELNGSGVPTYTFSWASSKPCTCQRC